MFFLLYRKELEAKGQLIINCKIKARAKSNEIKGFLDEKTVKIFIKKPAVNNLANLELIKYLKEIFLPFKVDIEILSGKSSSLKRLKIIKR